jgi:hypothetical protein
MEETEESYKTDLDGAIESYLNKYRLTFDLQGGASWPKFIYLMTDELLRNGLEQEDVMFIKQKYAEFRCSVRTKDEKKEVVFDKIVNTYSNAINSICELCENHGIVHTIEGWDYRLCMKHFLERANPTLDEETLWKLSHYESSMPELKESHYRNVFNRTYNALNDEFTTRDISIIFHYLNEGGVDKMLIRKVLLEFVSIDKSFGGVVVDGKVYERKIFYEDSDGNKVFPEKDCYSNEDYLLDEINKLTLK